MARNTQTLLSASIKSLMLEKSLDSITVNELVRRANINRKTFYYHFHGISDLLNWTFTEEIRGEIPECEVGPTTWKKMFADLLSYMRRNSAYLNAIYSSSYGASFRQALDRLFEIFMSRFVKAAIAIYEDGHGIALALSQQQKYYVVQYYTMAFFGMLEAWFNGGMIDSDQQLVYMLSMLSQDNMYETFEAIYKNGAGQSSAPV